MYRSTFSSLILVLSFIINASFISDECVKFLEKQAESLGLPIKVHSPVPGKPVVIITWAGLEPEQQSIILNSHMDVVPVYAVSMLI